MSHKDFPVALKYSRLSHAGNVLLHIRGRTELNIGEIGATLQPMLSAFRKIDPSQVDNFYELVYPIVVQLNKYCDLAESCSKSGAYQDRRQEALNVVLTTIVKFEADKEIMRLLAAMMRP